MKKIIIFFLLVFLPAPGLTAQQGKQTSFEQGRKLFEAGEFVKAYDALFEAFKENPSDQAVNFYLGRAAFEMGDYEAAIMAYDRILISYPDSERIKLELARTHFQLGSFETAKQLFTEVLETNPPEPVKEKINFFLETIKGLEKTHFFSGVVSTGINWDDNVRSAPLSNVISVRGAPVSLSGTGSVPVSDQIWVTTLALNHTYKKPDSNFGWKSTGVNYDAFYRDEDNQDLNVSFLGATSGPTWQTSRFMVELYGIYNSLTLDYDRYLEAYGVGSNFIFPFNQNLILQAGFKFEKRNYITDDTKDSDNLTILAGPIFVFGQNKLSATFSHEYEGADGPINSYDKISWDIRYDRQLPYDISIYGDVNFENSNYRTVNPFFGTIRSDRIRRTAVGISREFWRSNNNRYSLSISAGHTWTDAQSNQDIYAYKKEVSSVAMNVTF